MRVTNNMITSNTKSNINANKVLVDKYNTQMTTQKKINKPSDDPVIAIRSLRMQTSLSHIDQYLNNNISDANSWLNVTDTAHTTRCSSTAAPALARPICSRPSKPRSSAPTPISSSCTLPASSSPMS